VPFEFDRSTPPRYRLRNVGAEPLRGVTVTLVGSGMMPAGLPRVMWPGSELELLIRGDDLARDAILVIRWMRPNGDDYLWRVAF